MRRHNAPDLTEMRQAKSLLARSSLLEGQMEGTTDSGVPCRKPKGGKTTRAALRQQRTPREAFLERVVSTLRTRGQLGSQVVGKGDTIPGRTNG